MNIPADLKYTKNDEWIRIEGNTGVIGISDYAQEQLSDIVFVEVVVSPDDEVKQGDVIASLESVKAASDVYAPASGRVLAVNEQLPDAPETVNADPYGNAWLIKIELTNPAEVDGLFDAAGYEQVLQEKE